MMRPGLRRAEPEFLWDIQAGMSSGSCLFPSMGISDCDCI